MFRKISKSCLVNLLSCTRFLKILNQMHFDSNYYINGMHLAPRNSRCLSLFPIFQTFHLFNFIFYRVGIILDPPCAKFLWLISRFTSWLYGSVPSPYQPCDL